MTKAGKAAIALLLLLLLVFIIIGLHNPLSVSEISLSSEKIQHPVRIALITDLHSCLYGEKQAELLAAIEQQHPDLVCLCGDLFDDTLPDTHAKTFIEQIAGSYPCYYVTGNHEYRSDADVFADRMAFLAQHGITRLANESTLITVNGQAILLCGVDDPDGQSYSDMRDVLCRFQADAPENVFTLLLSHRPEQYALYTECGFDLTLCGHAHGGQWRIPLLLEQGLIAPQQGLFPKYTNGVYTAGSATVITSRGLAKETTIVPRLYNKPEVVMVELQYRQQTKQ